MLRMVFVVMLALIFIVGCGNDDEEPQVGDIEIGGIFSLTGDLTSLGEDSKVAMELAVADINAVLEDNEQEIEVSCIIKDSELDPAIALDKLEELHGEDIEIVVGPSSSAEVSACKADADANDILIISHYSTSGALAIENDNVFRFCASDQAELPAVVALMAEDDIDAVVPLWRNDAGNQGLHDALVEYFPEGGGTVLTGYRYETTTTDFSAALAEIKSQIEGAAGTYDNIAVYSASFGEIIQIFEAAHGDSVLESVKWFGGDGVALVEALTLNADASEFAVTVNCQSPNIARSMSARNIWEPLETRIKAETGRAEVNPFALAVYDAVMVAVNSKIATIEADFSALKAEFAREAGNYFGASGWTVLNAAGDRELADFDFWAVRLNGTAYEWYKTASYNGATGIVTH